MMGKPAPINMIPPELDEEDEAFVSYFWDLSRDRHFTAAGPAAIPWTACHAYALVLGLGRYEDLYDDFMFIIGSLDAKYIQMSIEETERERQKHERKGKSNVQQHRKGR
jgi:hypothetical protein